MGTPEWVIFAEYVRFNRAIVKPTATTVACEIRCSRSLSAQKKAWMNSGFCRERDETHGTVFGNRPHKSKRDPRKSLHYYIGVRGWAKILEGGKNNMAVKEKIRVRLKSYDHTLIDTAAEKIVDVAKRNGATVSGPVPLPTEKEIVTILRAVHKYKDSREQFELRTHKRLIDILKPSQKVVDALMNVELPAGVEIEVKL